MSDRALVEQLDQLIDAVLAGAQPPAADPALAALAAIARGLREMPAESFYARLKADLERRISMPVSAAAKTRVAPTREGLRTLTPFVAVPNAPELIQFLRQTFGAEETARHPHGVGDGFVAALEIGDSELLIMGGESLRGHERIGAFHVYVPDCDAVYNRAIEAGAVSMGGPADRPYGERAGFVKDAAGNHWFIATRLGSESIQGLGTVTPFVFPVSAPGFIEFVKQAFGAEEMARFEEGGRVVHAAVRIGGTVMEMGQPHEPQSMPTTFYLHVDDCDEAYRRAVVAGATSLWPPTNQSYGDRTAGLLDPFGHQWIPATHIKDVEA